MRKKRVEDLAEFLKRHVRVYGGLVARLAVDGIRDDPHLPPALSLLATILGGRSFQPPATVRDRIAAFVRDPSKRRMTAARCIFEIRGGVLFISRERRNLPEATIDPHESVIWDGRFTVSNLHDDLSLVAGKSGAGYAPGQDILSPEVPAGIARRAASTLPVCRREDGAADRAGCRVAPTIALFDLFLPEFDWILAQRCAELMGLPAYPASPLAKTAERAARTG